MRLSTRSALRTICTIAAFCALSPNTSFAADDLFSEIALESVFRGDKSSGESSRATASVLDNSQRVTGAASLTQLLNQAGLSSKKIDRSIVSHTMDHAGWSLPVLMTVDVDQDRLDLVMLLSNADDDATLDPTHLNHLFTANSEESPAFFAFSKKRKRIELRRSMTNRGVTPVKLKRALNDLALIAEAYVDSWSNIVVKNTTRSTGNAVATQTATTPEQPASPTPEKPASPPVSNTAKATLTLVGRWSASLGAGEAFAIQIASDGKFQLVHAKSGKTSVSKGTATRNGNQLTLADTNGTKLVGIVDQKSSDAFEFSITGSDGKVVRKVQFSKAK